MNETKSRKLREALEQRKAEIENDVSYMANEIRAIGVEQDDENGSLGNHMAEDGASIAEAERIITVTEDLQHILQLVDSALSRMVQGSYGICQRCGKPIATARLEAFPYVAYCISCQSILEREQMLRAGS